MSLKRSGEVEKKKKKEKRATTIDDKERKKKRALQSSCSPCSFAAFNTSIPLFESPIVQTTFESGP